MRPLLVSLSVSALLLLGYLWLFNPQNWFVPCSEHFDQNLLSVELGAPIDGVIQVIGKPTYRERIADTPDFHVHEHYYFCGPAPSWVDTLVIGKNEWYLAVDDAGRVVRVGWETRP